MFKCSLNSFRHTKFKSQCQCWCPPTPKITTFFSACVNLEVGLNILYWSVPWRDGGLNNTGETHWKVSQIDLKLSVRKLNFSLCRYSDLILNCNKLKWSLIVFFIIIFMNYYCSLQLKCSCAIYLPGTFSLWWHIPWLVAWTGHVVWYAETVYIEQH